MKILAIHSNKIFFKQEIFDDGMLELLIDEMIKYETEKDDVIVLGKYPLYKVSGRQVESLDSV